ncbi:MAG: hypothetical protein J0H56_07105 [Micrococcales bacterium]|nr:hypothetical protein [Micrococcales bacterium]
MPTAEEISMRHHQKSKRETGAQNAGMIAVLSHIDSAGFHGIDMALHEAQTSIDPIWSGIARNARIAVAATVWPEKVRAKAERFTATAGQLAVALEQGDAKAAADHAREAHGAQHGLSSAGWNYLAGIAGIQGVDGSQEHGDPRHTQ